MSNSSSSINFSDEQYEKLRQTYRDWWDNKLERPIVPIITCNNPSSRKPSNAPQIAFSTAWDFSISPQELVDAHDWYLSTLRWYGDAFPFFPMTSFGPGTIAAFLGCTPVMAEDTVWFDPPKKDIPIQELHFEVDENNPYLRRVLNVYEAAMEKWRGSVVVGMIDIGGTLDILSSFRGSENLLMDLYDEPEEVLRCVKEINKAWFEYFDKINAFIAPEAKGYSHWFNMFAEKPSYILQSDFSYMISTDMFEKFVKDELASSAQRIPNALYHMDGIGEIPHLEHLLSIDAIKAIQWVPGAGEPSLRNWDELLQKILDSGKKLISCNQKPDGSAIDIAKNKLGQLYCDTRYFDANDMASARSYAQMYGIKID